MTEHKETFLGTYFDSESVLLMARVIGVLSWIVAGIYLFDVVLGLGVLVLQYSRGLLPGMGFTDILQNLLFTLERPLHGILYFAAMQAVSKGLLILLDVEENTRRAARQ